MNNSSAQESYSITSSDSSFVLGDTITINSGSLNGSYTISGNTMNTVSMAGGSGAGQFMTSGNYTIGAAGSTAEYTWKTPIEFEDTFPDYDRIQKMCKEFPGLEIAFEKFKTTYYLVKDEYDNPKDKK